MNVYQNNSRRRRKIKRIVFSLCLVAMLTVCFMPLNWAKDSTPGRTYNWSPYTWSFFETYSTTKMTFKITNAKFSDSWSYPPDAIIVVGPTFDLKYKTDDGDAYATSSSYWATNFLIPVHDLDDDNGNGYCEEAEVTGTGIEGYLYNNYNHIIGYYLIDTSKSYYYYQDFNKRLTSGTHSGYMYFNMQQSLYGPDPFNIFAPWEHQAVDYDLLEKEYFSYTISGGGSGDHVDLIDTGPGNLSKISFKSIDKQRAYELPGERGETTKVQDNRMIMAEKAAEIQKIKIPFFMPSPTNQNAVNDLLAELKNSRRQVERISNNLNIEYVYGGITFDEPLQLDNLYLFLSQHDIRLDRFEGYAMDGDEIASFGGSALDGEEVDMARVESLVPANAEIKGIYAIWGWLPAARLEAIDNSTHVLALDLRAFEIHFLAWLHFDLTEVLAIDYEFDDLYWAIKQWDINKKELEPKIFKDPVEEQ